MSSVGPIPYTALTAYCERADLGPEQSEDFLWLLQRLDQKYLEWSNKRAKPS